MSPILLISGGMDSFTLAADLIINPHRYGVDEPPLLMHFTPLPSMTGLWRASELLTKKQIPFLEALTGRKLKLITPDLGGVLPPAGNVSRPLKFREGIPVDHRMADYGYTPGIHTLMCTVALTWASAQHSDKVFTGFRLTKERWRDLDSGREMAADGPPFMDAMNRLIAESGDFPLTQRVYSPFLDYRQDREHVLRLAVELGLETFIPKLTHSCPFAYPACRRCDQCVFRRRSFRVLGLKDK